MHIPYMPHLPHSSMTTISAPLARIIETHMRRTCDTASSPHWILLRELHFLDGWTAATTTRAECWVSRTATLRTTVARLWSWRQMRQLLRLQRVFKQVTCAHRNAQNKFLRLNMPKPTLPIVPGCQCHLEAVCSWWWSLLRLQSLTMPQPGKQMSNRLEKVKPILFIFPHMQLKPTKLDNDLYVSHAAAALDSNTPIFAFGVHEWFNLSKIEPWVMTMKSPGLNFAVAKSPSPLSPASNTPIWKPLMALRTPKPSNEKDLVT